MSKVLEHRQSNKKTRLGCHPCKARRVKCGEEKRICLICIRSKLECAYQRPPQQSLRLQRALKLRPKPVGTAILVSPSAHRFNTDQEWRYFETFKNCTAFNIFPPIERGKLRQVLLQICESQLSLRHAVIALGALDNAHRICVQSQPNLHPCHLVDDDAKRHHQNALQAYAIAIRHMRRISAEQDLLTVLMNCVAIFAFEDGREIEDWLSTIEDRSLFD